MENYSRLTADWIGKEVQGNFPVVNLTGSWGRFSKGLRSNFSGPKANLTIKTTKYNFKTLMKTSKIVLQSYTVLYLTRNFLSRWKLRMTKLWNTQLKLLGNVLVVPLKGPAKNYYFDENCDFTRSKNFICYRNRTLWHLWWSEIRPTQTFVRAADRPRLL